VPRWGIPSPCRMAPMSVVQMLIACAGRESFTTPCSREVRRLPRRRRGRWRSRGTRCAPTSPTATLAVSVRSAALLCTSWFHLAPCCIFFVCRARVKASEAETMAAPAGRVTIPIGRIQATPTGRATTRGRQVGVLIRTQRGTVLTAASLATLRTVARRGRESLERQGLNTPLHLRSVYVALCAGRNVGVAGYTRACGPSPHSGAFVSFCVWSLFSLFPGVLQVSVHDSNMERPSLASVAQEPAARVKVSAFLHF